MDPNKAGYREPEMLGWGLLLHEGLLGKPLHQRNFLNRDTKDYRHLGKDSCRQKKQDLQSPCGNCFLGMLGEQWRRPQGPGGGSWEEAWEGTCLGRWRRADHVAKRILMRISHFNKIERPVIPRFSSQLRILDMTHRTRTEDSERRKAEDGLSRVLGSWETKW